MSASHVQVAELIEVSLDDIHIPPGNHRQYLGDLNGLAESIRTIGLVQPITLRQRDAGGYELVAGQRRLAAARLAGLSTLPAVVRGYADVESRKAMAVENLNRKDLEPLEAAAAYQELLDLGIGNDEVAALVGTSAQQVSDHTSLLSLPRKVRRELAGGAIDYPTALLLAQLADTPERLTRALHNARNGWSLTSAVQHELHARELERKTESSRAELEKRGVPIIERPRDSFSPRAKVRRLGNGWGCIPLTQAKHARETCHAAYIEEHTGDIVFVCIDVQRHVGFVPGIEAPADAKAERAAKRSERQAQRRALAERRALLTRHLQSIDDAAAANRHAQRISVLDVEEAVASVACELLGLSGSSAEYHGHARTLTARVAANPEELSQVVLAVALGRAEVYSGREYISRDQRALVAEHLRYLTGLGYQPTELELDVIREQDITVGEENASANPDIESVGAS
jgi:ParB family transcriptional regulator, chromosome partitioning protein